MPSHFIEEFLHGPFGGKLTPLLYCYEYETGAVSIMNAAGMMPTLAELEELIALMYQFYEEEPFEDIDAHNRERRAYLDSVSRKPIPPTPIVIPRPGTIYLIGPANDLYKIGCTTNLSNRLRNLQTAASTVLTLVHSFAVDDMGRAEKYLHTRFAHLRSHGEWFALSPDDVQWISSLETL